MRPSYWCGLALSVLEVEPTKLTVGKSTKFLSFYVIFKSNTLIEALKATKKVIIDLMKLKC